jgi:ribosomal protein S18 acetylase RimI-like enzyme
MTSIAKSLLPAAAQGHLRPIHPGRDLPAIADLVELCFKDTLDADGRGYLKHMRQAARENELIHWASTTAEALGGMPVTGYVWEQDGQIIGNLSLIPLRSLGKRIYLIANVAVHPAYRGRGIGRMLTATAVEYAQSRGVHSAWLQVRHDNPPAIHIYQTLGFVERARRTSWEAVQADSAPAASEQVQVGRRLNTHWPLQAEWLKRLYPPELRWHLPVHWWLVQPGWWTALQRFLSLEFPLQLSAERNGVLQAVLTCHAQGGSARTIWLAAPPTEQIDEEAVLELLTAARQQHSWQRSFTLNLPAGYATWAVQQAGFTTNQTLIWMQIVFS